MVERGKDRYQRVLGRVYREDLDVNAEQVWQGMAWVYRRYAKDAALLKIEAEAGEEKRGLWHDPAPVPEGAARRLSAEGDVSERPPCGQSACSEADV